MLVLTVVLLTLTSTKAVQTCNSNNNNGNNLYSQGCTNQGYMCVGGAQERHCSCTHGTCQESCNSWFGCGNSHRRRATKRFTLCNADFITPCTITGSNGQTCNSVNSRCHTADTVCGTTYAVDLSTTLCPLDNSVLPTNWQSWMSLMQSAPKINQALVVVQSDKTWFDNELDYVLFNASNATMPTALQNIKNGVNYPTFTCRRNIAQCLGDNPQTTECMTACQSISTTLANFETTCNQINTANSGYTCGTVRTGCGGSWCTVSPIGQGTSGLGWTRNCYYMCNEFQNIPPSHTTNGTPLICAIRWSVLWVVLCAIGVVMRLE